MGDFKYENYEERFKYLRVMSVISYDEISIKRRNVKEYDEALLTKK